MYSKRSQTTFLGKKDRVGGEMTYSALSFNYPLYKVLKYRERKQANIVLRVNSPGGFSGTDT